jgi:hypothetical protein
MPVYAYVAPLEQATKITALRQVRYTISVLRKDIQCVVVH